MNFRRISLVFMQLRRNAALWRSREANPQGYQRVTLAGPIAPRYWRPATPPRPRSTRRSAAASSWRGRAKVPEDVLEPEAARLQEAHLACALAVVLRESLETCFPYGLQAGGTVRSRGSEACLDGFL